MVFTEGRQVCVQTCWKNPWFMKCQASRSYFGRHYCVDINCEHDEANRFAGCHHRDAWHAPTCSECARLFPNACGDQLRALATKQTPDFEYLEIQRWESPSEQIEAQEAEAARKRAEWLAALSAGSDENVSNSVEEIVSQDASEESSDAEDSSDKRRKDSSEESEEEDTSSARPNLSENDEGDECDNSWIDFWKDLLRSSRSVDCVSVNSAPTGDKPYNRVPALDAASIHDLTSFNEITFQIGGRSDQIREDDLRKIFSNLTGNAQICTPLILDCGGQITESTALRCFLTDIDQQKQMHWKCITCMH